MRLLLTLLITAVSLSAGSLSGVRQAVVVTTSGWDAVSGQLQRYERSSDRGPWRAVGERVPIVVGKSGMAWGIGLHPSRTPTGPQKKEGDGRSPAGIFRLTSLFGYAPQGEGFHLPYQQETPSLECVDDPKSKQYNRLVDRNKIAKPDWNSSEKMTEAGELYRWGAVVAHNDRPPRPGAGSCIFLHVARSFAPPQGTVGCTAMSESQLLEVLRWLTPAAHPVLVQMPATVYEQQRRSWQLP